jgi:predicted kinase
MDLAGTRPRLIAVAGLIGSGKSTLSAELSQRLGVSALSSDVTRKDLAGMSPGERGESDYGEGIYSGDFSERTYEALFGEAAKTLGGGSSVVIDASFARARHRARLTQVAHEAGAEAWVLECVADPDETRRRLERRAARPGSTPSDGRWETYLNQRAAWEPISDDEALRHAVIDQASGRKEFFDAALGILQKWSLEETAS